MPVSIESYVFLHGFKYSHVKHGKMIANNLVEAVHEGRVLRYVLVDLPLIPGKPSRAYLENESPESVVIHQVKLEI